MDDKKEIKRRKYCIVFKNGAEIIIPAYSIKLDDGYTGYDCLRLFNFEKNAFYEIAAFNFENLAGWYEVENCESEDNSYHER